MDERDSRREVVKIDELDKTPLSPAGWLDREGTFYQCAWAHHQKVASGICASGMFPSNGTSPKDPESVLQRYGWIKISQYSPYFAADRGLPEYRKPSMAQHDFVLLYLSTIFSKTSDPSLKETIRFELDKWIELWEPRL